MDQASVAQYWIIRYQE